MRYESAEACRVHRAHGSRAHRDFLKKEIKEILKDICFLEMIIEAWGLQLRKQDMRENSSQDNHVTNITLAHFFAHNFTK